MSYRGKSGKTRGTLFHWQRESVFLFFFFLFTVLYLIKSESQNFVSVKIEDGIISTALTAAQKIHFFAS